MQNLINCLIVDDEPVARDILETHLQKIDFVNVVATCKNAVDAFAIINSKVVDVVFLDINMPEVSGLSLAKSINKNIKIIFTTAYREYAVDGFNLEAVDYLLKPISFQRLLQAINKLPKKNYSSQQSTSKKDADKSPFIFVRSERKMVKINFSDINYIESLSDYIKIHLSEQAIVTRETVSNIEAKLPHNLFIRVHRSYIIAIDKINSFTNEFIEIKNKAIPISRSYKTSVLNKLESL